MLYNNVPTVNEENAKLSVVAFYFNLKRFYIFFLANFLFLTLSQAHAPPLRAKFTLHLLILLISSPKNPKNFVPLSLN